MENDNVDELEETQYFSDVEIFTHIWSSPRAVFRYILAKKYDKFVIVLFALAGVSRAFDRAIIEGLGDKVSLLTIIAGCVIVGSLLGWLFFYFFAIMLSWTGKWLEGKGDTKAIFRVLAYAMIPSVIALLFLIVQVTIYGAEVFKSGGDLSSASFLLNVIFNFSVLAELVLSVFGIIFMIVGVSEVQKVTKGTAFLNLLLPIIIIVIPLAILVLMLNGM